MVLAPRRLADDLGIAPSKPPEVIGQGDASQTGSSRRAAALADRNIVSDVERQRNHICALRFEDLAIGGEDQVVLQSLADLEIATAGTNGKFGGGPGIDPDKQIHRQRGGVKGRPQIR